MAGKNVKRTVAHPKLYMSVGGVLQHVKQGTEVTVSEEQCKNLGAKLADPADTEKLDATVKGGETIESWAEESEAVAALTLQLETAKAETGKANEALTATATKLAASEEAVKVLKKAAK